MAGMLVPQPPHESREVSRKMLVDSHVHIHSCYELDGMLDRAAENFRRAGSAGGGGEPSGCLMLTETAQDHVFEALACGDAKWKPERWDIRATADDAALLCVSPQGVQVLLLAGGQIVTSEKLEVLSLATAKRYPDGQSLRDTLAALASDGVLAVIPWGFGKWLMKRGRLLLAVIDSATAGDFFLGDNGGRPQMTRQPELLRYAEKKGFRILPGTDPFPFRSQQGKAGSYGFVVDDWVVDAHPAKQIRSRLRAMTMSPRPYGNRANLVEFAVLQVAMNVKNRLPRSA